MSYFIKLAGLSGFEKYYPAQLSGGMGKRASIIRALAYEPPVILMDEPFGPLDAQTRMVLQDELLKIWEQKRQTIVFVTHDLVEAVALADRVVVMTHRPGKIKDVIKVNMARPRNIFEIHRQDGFDDAYGRSVEHLSSRAQYRPPQRARFMTDQVGQQRSETTQPKPDRNAKVDIFAHCYRNANPQRHCRRLFPRVGIRVRQMDRTLSNQQPQPYFYVSVHRFLLR